MAESTITPQLTDKPKKRKLTGRSVEKRKIQRLSGHAMGPDCHCSRLQCFTMTTEVERIRVLYHFNALPNKDQQDSLLSSIISVEKIKQRRPRKPVGEAKLREHSFKYILNVATDGVSRKVPICLKAVLAIIFGITKSRIERIQTSLATTGLPPSDQRGKHDNRPFKFTGDQMDRICDHIKSFKGRSSHYALGDTKRLYLSEELNILKMYDFYTSAFPEDKCSYESYRKVFNEKFNISFGYPRKDTCSKCDEFEIKLQATPQESEEYKALEFEKELHLRKADTFYKRKAAARQTARASQTSAAIAFDYQKNLPCPNITTNDVYYRRQLSVFSFNVHNLSTDEAYFFCYDETTGKKGADNVTSMLHKYFFDIMPQSVMSVELFCDSCAGQNKNWTMLRYLHALVHKEKRFENIKITFPIRGHSFLECDRDMALINQKAKVDTPADWIKVIQESRSKPTPYTVVEMKTEEFLNFTSFLAPHYKASCPVQTRPLREVCFDREHPRFMMFREAWNGEFETAVMKKPRKRRCGDLAEVPQLHTERLCISSAKYKDLQVLKKFCPPAAQDFYDNLPVANDGEEIGGSSSADET